MTTKRQPSGAAAISSAGKSSALDAMKVKERVTRALTNQAVTQVVKGVKDLGARTFQPTEFHLLHIAEDGGGSPGSPVYQRGEDRRRVNELMAVLAQGGIIPDAIQVAVRRDGSYWIVDGGQRFRACYLMQHSIRAHLWGCQTVEQERQLFSVEQNRSKPQPGIRVQAWVGPAGELIRWLAESTDSPICGDIGMKDSRSRRWPVSSLAIGLQGAITASSHGGGLEDVLRLMDTALRDIGPAEGRRRAVLYVSLLKQVFEERRVARLAVQALGVACGIHWRSGTLVQPSAGTLKRLQRVNWDDVCRGHGERWVKAARDAVFAIWPVSKELK